MLSPNVRVPFRRLSLSLFSLSLSLPLSLSPSLSRSLARLLARSLSRALSRSHSPCLPARSLSFCVRALALALLQDAAEKEFKALKEAYDVLMVQ